jgi:ribosomal protein L37AE/L43A
MKVTGFELFCPRCGKRLSDRLDGSFTFHCSRCKSQIGGETKGFDADQGYVVSVVTASSTSFEKQSQYHT